MILTRIADWGYSSPLKELDLDSLSFDSDVSVRCFADILAKTPNLRICNITNQGGNRKVRVLINYASEVR